MALPWAFTVTFTASKKGEKSQIATITLNVEAAPDWAVGTFAGWVRRDPAFAEAMAGTEDNAPYQGSATMTVAANGKISGKVLESGKTWALSANASDAVEGPKSGAEGPTFFATVIGKTGKNVVTNDVTVASENGIGVASSLIPHPSSPSWAAWQNLWKRADTKSAMPIFMKNFDVTLELGEAGDANNTVKLTFKKDGVVAFAGKVGGASVSGTSQLVWGENGWQVTLYAPPKGAFAGFCETISVTMPTDDNNVVLSVAVEQEP